MTDEKQPTEGEQILEIIGPRAVGPATPASKWQIEAMQQTPSAMGVFLFT